MATTKLVNAQEFANGLQFPVVWFAGVGCPGGMEIALLPDTELPFDLSEIEGTVDGDTFNATNLTDGPGPHDWKFRDWNSNTVYKIQVTNDKFVWNLQNDEE